MTKDIEREAFEDWYCKHHTGLKQSDLYKFRTLSGYSFSDSLKINVSWEAWQAAKAHEAKKLEGCVVVPVESCKWTQDEDSNWWTQCGEGFVFNEDSHPHKHNFKNCCFCGGLLEAARGGNE